MAEFKQLQGFETALVQDRRQRALSLLFFWQDSSISGRGVERHVRILRAEQILEADGAGLRRGYLFNRFLLSSEHMCSNTSLENM